MTTDVAARYRAFALALPNAEAGSHMGVEDFRVGGKIFATLAYVAKELGTLKFTPEQQAQVLSEDTDGWFSLAAGGWGRMGMTLVKLDAPDDVLRDALKMAYDNAVSKAGARKRSTPAKTPVSKKTADRTKKAQAADGSARLE